MTLCSYSCSPTLCSLCLVRSRLAGFQCPPACRPLIPVHSASGSFSSPSPSVRLHQHCLAQGHALPHLDRGYLLTALLTAVPSGPVKAPCLTCPLAQCQLPSPLTHLPNGRWFSRLCPWTRSPGGALVPFISLYT